MQALSHRYMPWSGSIRSQLLKRFLEPLRIGIPAGEGRLSVLHPFKGMLRTIFYTLGISLAGVTFQYHILSGAVYRIPEWTGLCAHLAADAAVTVPYNITCIRILVHCTCRADSHARSVAALLAHGRNRYPGICPGKYMDPGGSERRIRSLGYRTGKFAVLTAYAPVGVNHHHLHRTFPGRTFIFPTPPVSLR